jgi:hypothetical protein
LLVKVSVPLALSAWIVAPPDVPARLIVLFEVSPAPV